VEILGDLLFHLAEACVTHIYRMVFHFCELGNLDDLVLRYLNSGALQFKKWAEEWLHEGKFNLSERGRRAMEKI